MKKSVLVVAVLLLLLLVVGVATAREQEEKGKEGKQIKGITPTSARLVGVWVPGGTKLPEGATMNIEFTRDGKVKVFGQSMVKGKVKKYNHEGAYKIVEGGLTLASRGPKGEEQKETIQVLWLTDREMVTRNSDDALRLFKKK
jgi:uncharacterized protein (TIGR03066 family)